MVNDATPRRLWALFEPIHAVTYFTPESRAAFEAVGLRGFWRGYFAGRAAPLGPVGPAPVVAAFFGFAPAMAARALPDVWTRATPEAALDARLAGARAALESVFGTTDVTEAATVLRAAAERVETAGRVLGAANAALPWPEAPVEVLWHAATVLREHRGDGHVAALVTEGLDGCESVVWRTALSGLRRGDPQQARGWTDEDWAAAEERLVSRGWLDPDGAPTESARTAATEMEAVTDRLAGKPWAGSDTARAEEVLAPLAVRVAALLRYPNPIGLPDPREPANGGPDAARRRS